MPLHTKHSEPEHSQGTGDHDVRRVCDKGEGYSTRYARRIDPSPSWSLPSRVRVVSLALLALATGSRTQRSRIKHHLLLFSNPILSFVFALFLGLRTTPSSSCRRLGTLWSLRSGAFRICCRTPRDGFLPRLSEAEKATLRSVGVCFHCRKQVESPSSPGWTASHTSRNCPGDAEKASSLRPTMQASPLLLSKRSTTKTSREVAHILTTL